MPAIGSTCHPRCYMDCYTRWRVLRSLIPRRRQYDSPILLAHQLRGEPVEQLLKSVESRSGYAIDNRLADSRCEPPLGAVAPIDRHHPLVLHGYRVPAHPYHRTPKIAEELLLYVR